jgi:hypothetical protein
MRVVVITCLLALSAPLSALTVKPLSFSELVTSSAVVVHGRVRDVHPRWTADRRGIESLVDVEVVDYLKGGLGEHVTVRVPGGRLGPYVNLIPGAPRFAEGDRVVLFLTVNGPTIPVVTGTSQGVYRVSPDTASGGWLVTPPLIEPGHAPAARGDQARRPVPLSTFGDAVRRAEAAR